ncbi:electron transport complex subunit RsxA [bacterium]|nr:electron transport complex subunit RsxA [bacterium]
MEVFTTYILIVINALLVTNVIFARFLGICPYLGVSKKISTSLGMGVAVVFVMTLAAVVTWPLQTYVLENPKLDLAYLQTIVFILMIASLVQLVELILKKTSPPLYRALGIYLPLITTNCAILGIAILSIQERMNYPKSIVFSAASGMGFTLALLIFAGIRERLELTPVPKAMRGAPIGLITAGILALAFMGFSGLGAH